MTTPEEKLPIVHRDILLQELAVGDMVVCMSPGYRGLQFGEILKINPKMVTIRTRKYSSDGTARAYPRDVCKVSPDRATYLRLMGKADGC